MKWSLVLTNAASRTIRRAPRHDRLVILEALRTLCIDPYWGDIKILKGTNGVFRRREGDWRVLFELQTEHRLIIIINVLRRGSHTY